MNPIDHRLLGTKHEEQCFAEESLCRYLLTNFSYGVRQDLEDDIVFEHSGKRYTTTIVESLERVLQ